MRKYRLNKRFTLAEIMVAIGISAMVMTVIYNIFGRTLNISRRATSKVTRLSSIRRLVRSVRNDMLLFIENKKTHTIFDSERQIFSFFVLDGDDGSPCMRKYHFNQQAGSVRREVFNEKHKIISENSIRFPLLQYIKFIREGGETKGPLYIKMFLTLKDQKPGEDSLEFLFFPPFENQKRLTRQNE